jgi:hypothetical protein
MIEQRDDYRECKVLGIIDLHSILLTLTEPDSLWYYAPNKGAPIAFAILFAVSGLWHLYLCLFVPPPHY